MILGPQIHLQPLFVDEEEKGDIMDDFTDSWMLTLRNQDKGPVKGKIKPSFLNLSLRSLRFPRGDAGGSCCMCLTLRRKV